MGIKKLIAGLCFFSAMTAAQVKTVNVEWSSIKNGEGWLKLKEVKVWGENPSSKYEAFKYPVDLCRDSKGNYYILDFGQHEISVFDKNNSFIRKYGKAGEGPGDFKFPNAIESDSKDNLIVAEEGNGRIQIFKNGKSSATMRPLNAQYTELKIDTKDRIVIRNKSIENGSSILDIYGYNKKKEGYIGRFSNDKKEDRFYGYFAKNCCFSTDNEGNYYIVYLHQNNTIEKYSPEGKLIMKINYKLALPPGEIKHKIVNGGATTTSEGMPQPISMDTDGEGNIYLLFQKRKITSDDSKSFPGFFSTTNGVTTNITVKQPQNRKSKYDLYAFVVLDKNGNVKGMQSIDYYANKIKVVKGDLFIFNSFLDAVIHQYRFVK